MFVKIKDTAIVRYSARTIDGHEYDASPKGGNSSIVPSQVLKGWSEALLLMREGDHWEISIPPELGYGDLARGAHLVEMLTPQPFRSMCCRIVRVP